MAKGWSFNALLSSLGGGAFLDVGTKKDTVASGDDSRIVGALQKGNNLSEVSSRFQSLVNLGGFPFKGRLISTDNLDDLTGKSYGVFYSINPSLAMNYPNAVAGALQVLAVGEGTNVIQIYWELGRAVFWRRHKYDGQNWQRWTMFASTADNLESLTNKDQALKNIGGFPRFPGLTTESINNFRGNEYGFYYQSVSSQATPERGYPTNVAGSLLVVQNAANGADGCSQIYTTYNTATVYIRNYYASTKTWTKWERELQASNNLSELDDKKKALVNLGVYDAIYPKGIIMMFATTVNPATLFPGTTWRNANDGRIIRSTTSSNAPNSVTGTDDISIKAENLPPHKHNITGKTNETGIHKHQAGQGAPGDSWQWNSTGTDNQGRADSRMTSEDGNHSHSVSGTTNEAYSGAPKTIRHLGASRFYSFWERVG